MIELNIESITAKIKKYELELKQKNKAILDGVKINSVEPNSLLDKNISKKTASRYGRLAQR